MRRTGQVVLAVLAIVAVAVLARPSTPEVSPPFEVERSTATPRPEPSTTPASEASEASERETPRPAPSEAVVTVHRFDPHTLEPLEPPRELPLVRPDPVMTQVSPDGRYLAVVQWPSPGTLVHLYETGDLTEPFEAIRLPLNANGARFSADSEDFVWLGADGDGRFEVGGVRLGDGPPGARTWQPVAVPIELTGHVLEPLGGGRVGLHGYSQSGSDRLVGKGDGSPSEHGPLRLAVVDLTEGRFSFDVELPTASDIEWSDDGASFRTFGAGVAWDAVRDRAYVAHADRDAVLVVDLGTGDVVSELHSREGSPSSPALQPPLEDFRHDGPHEARWREALLSPDGSRLYASGNGFGPSDANDQGPSGREFELPILLADLVTGELTVSDVTGTRVLAVSADAVHVAVTSTLWGVRPHDVRVLDGATLEQRWERVVDNPIAAAFAPDSSLVSVLSIPEDPSGAGDTYRLEVFDVRDGSRKRSMSFGEGMLQHHLHAGIVVQHHLGR